MNHIIKYLWCLKGVWVHPEIDNPEYKQDDKLYARKEICAIGFDLWQVKSGTIFNNVLITDDIELAKEKADAIWKSRYVSKFYILNFECNFKIMFIF